VNRLGRAGIGTRIALSALAISAVTVGIVAVGVIVIGGQSFTDLMTAHGESADEAREMFESTVLAVLVVAVVVSILLAALLAAVTGRWLARPLRDLGASARRIAEGGYGTQLPRQGTDELASLIDSFNQMSASLLDQERLRREFVANAAHELRTPLTNLKGYLEGLRDGVIDADRATFESLWEETERLVRLSESLDRLEDQPAPMRMDVDVSRAVDTAVALSRPAAAEKDLTWTIHVAPMLAARSNPDHLAQVLANLLQNAVRYTPAGGGITVRAEETRDDVLVSVANTGAPIRPAELSKVFERFYRIDRSRDRRSGGAGIGLAIVKQLVETAGGRVGADSSDGQTTFWFSLPRA
jgi:two-component system, OmpR family, sensor histidine kinase BaeS